MTAEHFSSSHSVSKTFVILSLLALIFILPISVLFLNKTTENRPQASESNSVNSSSHIQVENPYISFSAADIRVIYSEDDIAIGKDDISEVEVYPFMHGDQEWLRMILHWSIGGEPVEFNMTFSKSGTSWQLAETSVDFDFVGNDDSSSFYGNEGESQLTGLLGTASTVGTFYKTYTNVSNANSTLSVVISNLSVEPFLYQLTIPETETGYFIENPPEVNASGFNQIPINEPGFEIGILRDAEGKIVKNLSSFNFVWSTSSDNVTLTPVAISTTECVQLGFNLPCPSSLKVQFSGNVKEMTTLQLEVSQNGNIIATKDFPVTIGDNIQHPLDINTPYLSLHARDFYVQHQNTTYYFSPSEIENYYTDIGRDDRGNETLSLGITWKNSNYRLRLGMYFKKMDGYWRLYATQLGSPVIDNNNTFELIDETINAPLGSPFTSEAVEQELTNPLNTNQKLFIHYKDLIIQPFKYNVEIPDTETGYFIENPPYGNETGIPVTPLDTRGIETAVLRDDEGNIVIDQSSFRYIWTTESSNIELIENTPQFCNQEFGIQEPCPAIKVAFNPLAIGPATIHLSVMQGDVEVAQADFPIVVGPTLSPIPSQPVTIIPTCPADTRSTSRKADFNNDNKINLTDYNILVRDFLKSNRPSSDANCDGKVNLKDYNILVRDFLK